MFIWRLFLDKLPLKENLRKRNILVDDDDFLCPVYHEDVESINHVIFNCGMAHSVWKTSYNWINLQIVLPQSPVNHFCPHSLGLPNKTKEGFGMLCGVL